MGKEDKNKRTFKLVSTLEQRCNRAQMDLLASRTDETVIVTDVYFGKSRTTTGRLELVLKYVGIVVNDEEHLFVSGYNGIKRVTTEDERHLLYENIPLTGYCDEVMGEENRVRLIAEYFGRGASRLFRKNLGIWKARETREKKKEEALKDAKAREKKDDYIAAGSSIVNPGAADKWGRYVKKSRTAYGLGIIKASLMVMEALTAGKSLEEAAQSPNKLGLTAGMVCSVVHTVANFHPRGKEYKDDYIKRYNPAWG